MKALLLIILLSISACWGKAQVKAPTPAATEQQLESLLTSHPDMETDDDAYLQRLHYLLNHPIDINEADPEELGHLQMISPIQVQQLISYLHALGPLVSGYELQAVPLWDIDLIQKIRPYITVSTKSKRQDKYLKRLTKGEHSVLLRVTQVLERAKGYDRDTAAAADYYRGSPQHLLWRYQYNYKHLLQYGIVAEKDAGEQFFKGRQQQGFDFYSFYFFIGKLGLIRSLALGDFVVNMGQGLLQWQSLSFKKSVAVMNIKREAPFLMPYHAAGEINFHRGIGITLQKNKWQLGFFASYKKVDGNGVKDTITQLMDHISSLQSSGYHRTKAEADDKGIQRQLTLGSQLVYQHRHLHLGINAIWYKYKLPLVNQDEPYDKYGWQGRSLGNFSFDYGYTHKNFHLFGELAATDKRDIAFLNGILISVSAVADLCLLYRYMARSYHSLYSSAFTEGADPQNESGLYAGITIRPNSFWRIDAYADLYQSPWLKYRVDKPAGGSEFFIQATYRPGKRLEMYSRYRIETKAINDNPDNEMLSPVAMKPRQNWCTNISYRVNRAFTLRCRINQVWFDKKGDGSEEGFLGSFDLLYKPELKPFSANLRGQYFETGGYNSRIYAYENDVLYNFSIPVFYDKGYRYYINLNYDINKKCSLWIRWAQTIFSNKTFVGSGLDEISGAKKTEAKLQVIYHF